MESEPCRCGGEREAKYVWPKEWAKDGVQRVARRGKSIRVGREGLSDCAATKERAVAWRALYVGEAVAGGSGGDMVVVWM